MSKCSMCHTVVKEIVDKVVIGESCGVCEGLIGAAFTALELADIFEPEFEPILIAVEIVFEGVFSHYCNEYGTKWIKDNVKEFSDEVCKKAHLC